MKQSLLLLAIAMLMPVTAQAVTASTGNSAPTGPAGKRASVAQAEFQEANAAYQRGNYKQALIYIRQLAAQGYASAEDYLGAMYTKGQGVPQDYAKALKWYRLAAAQGSAAAEFNLGAMYYAGSGVPQNYVKALQWFRMSVAQGCASAETDLGAMYAGGQGIPQDYAKALKWYRLAAAQGEVDAEFNLGAMYTKGQGVPQDYTEAYKWLLIAKATLPATDSHYAMASERVDELARSMTKEQIAQAQQEASAWYAKHVAQSR
ncbi:MAG: tetratricopeptide repeat protein [Pseudomonadota bacterium]|nr:tetratricopeptide repeat protein [Pseudomonadota bacterium]